MSQGKTEMEAFKEWWDAKPPVPLPQDAESFAWAAWYARAHRTPLVPCPVCGGEAVHAQDVLARTVIQPELRCICAEAPGGKCICGCGAPVNG